MFKKILFIGMVLLFFGSVSAYNQPAPLSVMSITTTPVADLLVAPIHVPFPTPEQTVQNTPVIVVEKPVGSWMTLFLMHNSWNPETRKWEKRILPKSILRGTYDFKTKTWTKK